MQTLKPLEEDHETGVYTSLEDRCNIVSYFALQLMVATHGRCGLE